MGFSRMKSGAHNRRVNTKSPLVRVPAISGAIALAAGLAALIYGTFGQMTLVTGIGFVAASLGLLALVWAGYNAYVMRD